MGAVEFYYHCPTEVLTSAAETTAALQTWLESNALALQDSLAAFLALTGRDNEDVELSVASYLASTTTQPLHSLVSDMTASSRALAFVVPGQTSFFNFRGGYLHLYAGDTSTRNATPSTAHFLRHIAVGDVVAVQIKGDPFTLYHRGVTDVTTSTITLDAPELPETDLIVVSIAVPDAARLNDVIVFRQYHSFDAFTTGDEATFNPQLYMLLYRGVSPEIVGMTVTQLFQHYTNAVSRIGNVDGLRMALNSPIMSEAEVTNLLKIGSNAAIYIDGVHVRNITSYADVLAQNNDSRSDASLLTAKAAALVIENRLSKFGSHFSTDVLYANTVNTGRVVATQEIYVPESFKATASNVTIFVPLDVPTMTSGRATFQEADVTAVRAKAIQSDDVAAKHLTSTTLAVASATIDGAATAGAVFATTIVIDGSATLGAITAQALAVDGTATANKVDTGALTVSGTAHLFDAVIQGDACVSGKFVASCIDAANGGFEVTPSGDVVVRTKLNTSVIDSAVINGTVANVMEGHVKDLLSEYVQSDRAKLHFADVSELSLGHVIGDLVGANLMDAQRLIVYGDIAAEHVETPSLKTTKLDVVDGATVGHLHVLEDIACDVQLNSHRIVTNQLDVPGPAFVDTLAVAGLGSFATVHVAGDSLVAGNSVVAGLLDVNYARVRGSLTATRGVFSDGLWVEWGDLAVSRGNATIFGNAAVGGKLAVEDTVTASKGIVVSSGGIESVGNTNLLGDVSASGSISAASLALHGNASVNTLVVEDRAIVRGEAEVSTVRARGDWIGEGSVRVQRDVFAGGNVVGRGELRVDGAAFFGGKLSADGSILGSDGMDVSGDVALADNLSVEGDVSVAGRVSSDAVHARSTTTTEGLAETFAVSHELHAKDLTVRESAVLKGTLSVGCAATFVDAVTVGEMRSHGRVSVSGRLSANDVVTATIQTGNLDTGTLTTNTLTCDDVVAANSTVTGKSTHGEIHVGGDLDVRGKIYFGTEPVVIPTSIRVPVARVDEAVVETVYVRRIGIAANPVVPPQPATPADQHLLLARLAAMETELATLRAMLTP